MKKVIFIIIMLFFLFAACQKDEVMQPDTKSIKVELQGAFTGYLDYTPGSELNYVELDTLQYLINVNVNGLDHYTKIEKIVNSKWVGSLYYTDLQLKKEDRVKIEVISKPNRSYVYMDVYSHAHHKNKFVLKDTTIVNVPAFDWVLNIE